MSAAPAKTRAAPHPFFKKPGARDKLTCRLLLYGLQSPINIGMILRVAETYQVRVGVHDPSGVFDNADKLKVIGDFACGALQRAGYAPGAGKDALAGLRKSGRLVAATIDEKAVALPEFAFARSDIVLIGNEYDGLPDDIAGQCDVAVRIPMADVWTPKPASHSPIDPTRRAPVANDGKPNLNAAMSAGIICYAAFLAAQTARRASPAPDRAAAKARAAAPAKARRSRA